MYSGSCVVTVDRRPVAVFVFTDGCVLFELSDQTPLTFKNGERRRRALANAKDIQHHGAQNFNAAEFAQRAARQQGEPPLYTTRVIPNNGILSATRRRPNLLSKKVLALELVGSTMVVEDGVDEAYVLMELFKKALGTRFK